MSSDDARRRMEYSAIGGALAQLDSKNPQAAQLIAGLTRVIEFADVDAAVRAVKSFLKPGDVVLLKASRSSRLERIADTLKAIK